MPLAVLIGIRAVSPEYLDLFNSWWGQLVLVGCLASVAVGYLAMRWFVAPAGRGAGAGPMSFDWPAAGHRAASAAAGRAAVAGAVRARRLLLLLTVQPVGGRKSDLAERLRRLDVDERIRGQLERRDAARPIFASRWLEGLLRPVLDDLGRLVRSVLVRFGLSDGRDMERKLSLARPGVEPIQFLGEKVATGLVLMTAFPIFNAFDLTLFGPWPVWVWLGGFVVGFLAPDWQLEMRLAARRTRIAMELPTVLDMLTIAASAGLALEQALLEVSRHSAGLVAQELQRASREMALGQHSMVEALQAMAERNGVPELTSVIDHLRRGARAGTAAGAVARGSGGGAARTPARPHRRGRWQGECSHGVAGGALHPAGLVRRHSCSSDR